MTRSERAAATEIVLAFLFCLGLVVLVATSPVVFGHASLLFQDWPVRFWVAAFVLTAYLGWALARRLQR